VLQYQIVVPTETAHETMTRVIERIAADRRASFLGVIKSMGEQGEGLLSFPRPGLTLSVDFPYTGPDLISLLHGLDDLVAAAGGRVYLAKDACLRAEHVDAMYPGAARFRAIKAKVDPEGRFSSSLSRRLGLSEPS
jgi:decaprenylphospho-beta-D-ribofuranose 2-oxidase